jgi:hypothetical protein
VPEYSSGKGEKYQASISHLPSSILGMFLTFVISSCSFSNAAVAASITSSYVHMRGKKKKR